MDNLRVKLKKGSVEFSTLPVFGSDIKLQLNRESEQVFRREKLSGTFRFVDKDFDLIASCSANTELTLEFYRGEEFVGKGTFYKTDCRMDFDNRICEVSLTTTDKYEKIMNGLNNKFNLIKLAPKIETATLTRRAVLQLYTKGENKLTNILGGVHFEQDCQEVNDEQELINTYGFGTQTPLTRIYISPNPGESTGREGAYDLVSGTISTSLLFRNRSGYKISSMTHWDGVIASYWLALQDPNGTTIATAVIKREDFLTLGERILQFKDSPYGVVVIATGTQYYQGSMYARILTPEEYQGGRERPTEDITEYNSNYRGIMSMNTEDIIPYIYVVHTKSDTPTEWGIDSNLKYFMSPTLTATQKTQGVVPIPIGRSHWELFSIWLMSDTTLSFHIDRYDNKFELRDAYSVGNCIKVLLKEIDPLISFEESPAYSLFLSSREADIPELADAYPFPRTREARLFISQITNIKKTRYEQAAQRGDISLRQILDMLRNVYRCYWWIDENNRLRIEHITYLKNGRQYLDSYVAPQIDLTQMTSFPTGKKWGYNTNILVGDKSRCPARYEFGWGDTQTEQFNGYAIDLADKYIDHSKTEKITIENFIADLDYTIINPNGVGDDLFALFEVYNRSREVALADVRLSNTSPLYRMQNGYCSFLFAEANYYPYDLGGWKAKANGETLSVIGTKPFKAQELSFPITLGQARSVDFVRTDMGIGELGDIDIEADTLHANAKIYLSEKEDITNEGIVVRSESPFAGRTEYYATNNTDYPVQVFLGWYEPLTETEVFSTILQPKEDRLIGSRPTGRGELVLFNAEDASIVEIGKPNITYGSQMECVILYGQDQGREYCQIDFDGHHEDQSRYEYTWGLCSILAKKDLRISCIPSTEEEYDLAWANPTPCITLEQAEQAQYHDSGENDFSFTLRKGESICIGYTKDVDTYGNADFVRFIVREI